jgi:hypothetical protein
VHEEVDVEYVFESLNEIRDRVNVGEEDDFLQEFVGFDDGEYCFGFQTRKFR